MARPRKITSPRMMEKKWEEYKRFCDQNSVVRTEFNQKTGTFVTEQIPTSISYTIEGFCVWLGIARSNFYDTYDQKEEYRGIISRIREECETDVRQKFEKSIIPSRLAPLWMSKFGYSTKAEEKVDADTTLNLKVDYGDSE